MDWPALAAIFASISAIVASIVGYLRNGEKISRLEAYNRQQDKVVAEQARKIEDQDKKHAKCEEHRTELENTLKIELPSDLAPLMREIEVLHAAGIKIPIAWIAKMTEKIKAARAKKQQDNFDSSNPFISEG